MTTRRDCLLHAPRVMTPLALLALLAKPLTRAEVELEAQGERQVRLLRQMEDGVREVGCAPHVVFLETLALAWIEDVAGEGVWRASRAGIAALRRARSGGGGAPSPVQAQAATTAPKAVSGPSVDPAESPLGWLRRRKDKDGRPLIPGPQFDAGERLRSDLWFAQMTPRVTANWSAVGGRGSGGGPGGGVDIADNVAAAQQRVRRALHVVGPEFAGVLVDVCGHLKGLEDVERARGWPTRSGKVVLTLALTRLARHYGLIVDAAPQAGPLRHWGEEGYRPSADSEASSD